MVLLFSSRDVVRPEGIYKSDEGAGNHLVLALRRFGAGVLSGLRRYRGVGLKAWERAKVLFYAITKSRRRVKGARRRLVPGPKYVAEKREALPKKKHREKTFSASDAGEKISRLQRLENDWGGGDTF